MEEISMDWENLFAGDERASGVIAEGISDGLILSLKNLGCVDIEYISLITGEDYKTVITALKGSIYQNPDTWGECFFKGWETAEEYLSGNLLKKWQTAELANKDYDGYFSDNLKAIEKLLKNGVTSKDIYITLGSPWVPADVIDDFITDIFGSYTRGFLWEYYASKERLDQEYGVRHDLETGSWEIPNKSRYCHRLSVTNTYGTPRLEALHILERTLNMKAVSVYDEVEDPTGENKVRRVLNQEETLAALEKQKLLIKTFQEWVWKDKKRKKRLETIFQEKYGSVRKRIYDGSFLEFKGMAPEFSLYPYQKNAVARILFSKNTLLAHDVGAGKTYVMITAGMELRRMGLSKKNLYVVPNNIVGQWENLFKKLYENANILCVEPRSFRKEKRKQVLESIRDEEYDAIIMAYSCFEQITVSRAYYEKELWELREKINQAMKNSKRKTTKVGRKKKAIDKALGELSVMEKTAGEDICFDELGITRLFVDEAHNYKNVPLDTQIDNVLGINRTGSKKCQDMMDKVHIVQRENSGGGVVMATGTPITNSITDVYVFQKYLQDGELAMMDLQHFDSWIGMFAERSTNFEVDVDTNNYRMATRFAKFHNLPELTVLLSSIADFHQVGDTADLPDFEGYKDCMIPKTKELQDYLDYISSRTEDVRSGAVSRKEDNMLMITTDGRKAALDLRLVEPNASFTLESKVAQCGLVVADFYKRTMKDKGTQIVFCDSSTPKEGFNLYTELKKILVLYGIPLNEIAFIHDAKTESQRKLMFEKMRTGEIRVLIGSTFKLGLGVNVQDRLRVIHHLDVPWRPADMVQREGRILRQGNKNEKIDMYRYITRGSFDAYSWQLLESKQRFISELLAGTLTERSGTDIENTVLNYAEVKALAVGNPLIKERVEKENEISRLRMLQHSWIEKRIALQKELNEIPGLIQYQQEKIVCAKEDFAYYTENRRVYEKEERKALREQIHSAVLNNELETKERILLAYQGFDVILPANMKKDKPFIWLKREGRYCVELGDSEIGDLIRIDNFLDGFPAYIEKQNGILKEKKQRQKAIREELREKKTYLEEITELQRRIEEIDIELGVKVA